jgi:SAM-dependent methyltransferase
MNITKLWDICMNLMYDDSYFKSLNHLLKIYKVKTVLDCSGKTGLLSLRLKKLGFDISYSDENEIMHKYFKKKLENSNLEIPNYLLKLEELVKINKKFDAVLCRGDSFLFEKTSLEDLKLALSQFSKVLNKKGILYLDVHNCEKDFYEKKFSEKVINGRKAELKWQIKQDFEKKTKIWKCILRVNGKNFECSHQSYLLTDSELKNLLEQAGFEQVRQIEVKGEDNYEIFIGVKS